MDLTGSKVSRGTGAAQSETLLDCVADAPVRRHTLALKLVLGLTLVIMVAEVIGGWLANSLALLADAGHMLTDSAAVALALFASWVATRPATTAKTFGYLRLEILAALINGTVLIGLAGLIVWQALGRFVMPPEIEPRILFGVATVGLIGNVVALKILHSGHEQSLNVRGAYLHVLGDLLGSIGAMTAGAVILLTGWTLADPLISLLIAILILVGAVRLVRESVDVLLEATPPHIDLNEVADAIAAVPGVGHAVVCEPEQNQRVLSAVQERMTGLGIDHVTVQIENDVSYCR